MSDSYDLLEATRRRLRAADEAMRGALVGMTSAQPDMREVALSAQVARRWLIEAMDLLTALHHLEHGDGP